MGKVREHNPVVIEEFNGLWSRGDDESCPKDHLLLANNVQFIHSGIETRQAVKPYKTNLFEDDIKKTKRVYNYTTQNGQTLLVLTDGGKLYHVVAPDQVYLILTIGPKEVFPATTPVTYVHMGMEDFGFISIAGRAYITPFRTILDTAGTNYSLGLPGEFVYVYYRPPGTPVGTTIKARPASGEAPSNTNSGGFTRWNEPFLAYTSPFAGTVTQGQHAFAVSVTGAGPVLGMAGPRITSTGTDPIVFAVGYAPGDKAIQLTGIPVGNVGTINRVIYMSKANIYTPGVGTPLFEAITINDNFTTSIRIDIPDANLTVAYVPGTEPAPFKTALVVENVAAPVTNPPTIYYSDLGFHLVGVVFETDTGYLSAPGPQFIGGNTYVGENYGVKVSNIPVGPVESVGPPVIPSRVVKRHLVSTKAIPEYNGDQKGYQFFFIPNGTIENNTDTTKTVSYYDSDLVADASHLTENFSKIPAGVALGEYHSRMVLVGDPSYTKKADGITDDTTKPDNRSVAWVSAAGEPESINQIDGLIITPLDGNPLTHCEVFRDVLYLFKQTRTYSVVDNEDEPVTWGPVEAVDEGIGCPVHGIAEVLDSGGVNTDYLITASQSGLMLFNGTYARPELSWKIENIWNHFDKNKFHKISIVNDSIRKKIWMTFPDDLTLLLLADYSNGLNPKDIRWALWNFDLVDINSIVLFKTDKLILGTYPGPLVFREYLPMIRSKIWPPPDGSGYPSDITAPPHAFPGTYPEPPEPNIGGGLMIMDPANTDKFDQFANVSTGSVHDFPIRIAVRTAFLGE